MTCIVRDCNSRPCSQNVVTFHRFPSNTKLIAEWKKILGVRTTFQIKRESDRVCSKHFLVEDFEEKIQAGNLRKRYLRPGSMPIGGGILEEDNKTLDSKPVRKRRGKKCSNIPKRIRKTKRESAKMAEANNEITSDSESVLELTDDIQVEPTEISYDNAPHFFSIIELD